MFVLDAAAIEAAANELGDVLADCVNGGASVNFMLPYSRDDAASFFAESRPRLQKATRSS
jgi:hypothetical protein